MSDGSTEAYNPLREQQRKLDSLRDQLALAERKIAALVEGKVWEEHGIWYASMVVRDGDDPLPISREFPDAQSALDAYLGGTNG